MNLVTLFPGLVRTRARVVRSEGDQRAAVRQVPLLRHAHVLPLSHHAHHKPLGARTRAKVNSKFATFREIRKPLCLFCTNSNISSSRICTNSNKSSSRISTKTLVTLQATNSIQAHHRTHPQRGALGE